MNDSSDALFEASYLESTHAFKPILICGGYCDGGFGTDEDDELTDVAAIHAEVAGC